MVTEMFHLGLDEFHINKYKFGPRDLRKFLGSIPVEYHDRIVLHSMHGLAVKLKLGGVHLYRKYRDRKLTNMLRLYWLRFRHRDIQFSCSSGKLANLYEESNFITQIILSPIFDSTSKHRKAYQSAFSETGLRHALASTHFTVIAFGGITFDKIDKIKELGFDGVALKNGVWKAKDPVMEFKKIKAKLEE